ncbi:hypothetical protein [Rubritalea sp.]|uniref:hypothetical protein n=1 Tax=Rubritalea sp. TaxID=2109375 RepID=UPI003EF220DA
MAISLTHFFYNRSVEKRWAAVQERWADEVGPIDLDAYFPSVSDAMALDRDQGVIAYFSQDERQLADIGHMYSELIGDDSYEAKYSSIDSVKSWFDDKDSLSDQEAAQRVLKMLAVYDDEVSVFTNAARAGKVTQSPFNPGLSVARLEAQPNWTGMDYMGVMRFFSDRVKLHLLSGDREAAKSDLSVFLHYYDSLSNDAMLVSALLRFAYQAEMLELLSFGVERHLWDEEMLDAVKAGVVVKNPYEQFKHSPIGEYEYNRAFKEFKEEYGDEVYVEVVENGKYGVAEIIDLDRPLLSIVDWEELLAEVMLVLVPSNYIMDYESYVQSYILDTALPLYEKEPDVNVYMQLRAEAENVPQHFVFGNPVWGTFVKQYEEMLNAVVDRRLALLSIELERYYLKNGSYPESLDVLESVEREWLADPYAERALVYEKGGEAGFSLYSVGPRVEFLNTRWPKETTEEARRIYFPLNREK